jgi:hypothetical protein
MTEASLHLCSERGWKFLVSSLLLSRREALRGDSGSGRCEILADDTRGDNECEGFFYTVVHIDNIFR